MGLGKLVMCEFYGTSGPAARPSPANVGRQPVCFAHEEVIHQELAVQGVTSESQEMGAPLSVG
jgi:hypothetical protein